MVIVSIYNPISVRDAIRIAVPVAPPYRSTGIAASLSGLAREGLIERIAPGLYDAPGEATRDTTRRVPASL